MSENSKWVYLPVPMSDWGGVEAWFNMQARKGWHFVDSKGLVFIKLAYRPTSPHGVYRIKRKTNDSATINLREQRNWRYVADAPGLTYQLWWKETEDSLEFCPDAYSLRQKIKKEHRDAYINSILYAVWLLIHEASSYDLPNIMGQVLFNSYFCGVLILLFALIKWRNYQNSEHIGWPSIIFSTILGNLSRISFMGSVILYMVYLF